jgi:hypothetical protein
VPTPAMKAAAAPVETTSMESSTEARLPTCGEASSGPTVIKAAERSGVCPSLGMRPRESMLR